MAPGAFAFWKVSGVTLDTVSIVHINTEKNGWYHNGIPGNSNDILSTAKTLTDIANDLGATKLFTFGASMGAYAAALFGCLIGAHRVLMISAETILNLPGSRSAYFGYKNFDSAFMDINYLMHAAKGTEFIWWLGEDDPVDLYCAERAKSNPNVATYILKDCGHLAAKKMQSLKLLDQVLIGLVSDQFPHNDFKAISSLANKPNHSIRELFFFFLIYIKSDHLSIQKRYDTVAAAISNMYPAQSQQSAFHAHFARIFLYKQNYPACAVASSAAVTTNPNDAESYLLLSTALLEQGKHEKAQRAMRRALMINPLITTSNSITPKIDPSTSVEKSIL